MTTGKYENYYWITIPDQKSFYDLLENFEAFFLNLNLAIISFDGDAFIPTEEEYARGWIYNEHEVAIFNKLNKYELSSNIQDDCYDQWILFNRPIDNIKMEIFVTYSGFNLDINSETNELIKNVAQKFWNWIIEYQPTKFVINGDYFIYGTTDQDEIELIKKTWG